MPNSLRPCRLWPARLLCQGGGVLQARILEDIGQYGLPCPSRPQLFPAALATNFPEYLLLPEALRPKQLHHLHTWPSPHPRLPRQPLEQTPVDDPHVEVEIKPQLKPRGSVAEEEDPKLSTICTSCRLSPHDQQGQLWVYGIYKRSVRAPTKENAPVLGAIDFGGKNTQV